MIVENEIDEKYVFKQAASNLLTVKNLDESLNRFGYDSDDRIERRELVLMYGSIKNEMENEISNLAHDSAYDAAKEMRQRLTSLKQEFAGLQTSGAKLVRDDQSKHFDKAANIILTDTKCKHDKEEEEIVALCNRKRLDLEKTHAIQLENLEKNIARMNRPPTKYSKRLIELFKAESGLIKLCEYEEARKVRNMIDKILPGEVKKSEEEFDNSIETAYKRLRDTQAEDDARLEEKLKALVWKDKRRRNREMSTGKQRIKNHLKDMTHTHQLENRLKPEMSVKPSALWKKRPGYNSTSASMRGQHLMDFARGKKEGDVVFADSLVDKHNFVAPLHNTITLSSSSYDLGSTYDK